MSRESQPSGRGPLLCRLPRLARAADGAAAVEFAIIAPALLMLLLGIAEVARGLWLQNALSYAVEQAARCASINQNNCGSAAQVQSYAAGVAGTDLRNSTFTVTTAACGNLVAASYPMELYIPFVGSALTLSAQSCYP
jgi:Flp pilus assembly protein TadG